MKNAQWLIILLFLPIISYSQDTIYLKVISPSPIEETINFSPREMYPHRAVAEQDLNEMIRALYGEGYLTARVDSLRENGDTLLAWAVMGSRYEWVHLRPGNVDEHYLSAAKYRPKRFEEVPFSMGQLYTLQSRIINFAENNGYPFATIRLDSFAIDGNLISAALKFEKNDLIVFDTLQVVGTARIASGYLENYLDIKPDEIYDESLVQRIDRRLRGLTFVTVMKPAEIIFVRGKARVRLFLDDRKVNRFNFLLGILPNSDQLEGRILVTGEAGLNLQNAFGRGERLLLEWENLQPRSPKLDVEFAYPYLFSLPFGAEAGFHLFKRDTFYLNLEQEFAIQYLFTGNNYLKGFVRNKTTNLITVDTLQVIATRELPQNIDTRTTYYGLEYHMENLDYRFNPRKGYDLTASVSVGLRNIRKNNEILFLQDPTDTAFNFESLYGPLALNSTNWEISYDAGYFFPLGGRSTILARSAGAYLINEQLFDNELFRIGGSRLLRGFDEESIETALYNVVTAEYRYLLGENSYFNIFVDGAYVRPDFSEAPFFPYGFGAGLAFETTAGIFAVNYALGKLNDQNPIQFRNAKIHFGYLSYF